MRSHDYTQEVGIATTDRRAPLAVTIIAFAIVAAAAYFFVKQAYFASSAHAVAEAPAGSAH